MRKRRKKAREGRTVWKEEMGQQISFKGRTMLGFWGLEEENGTADGERKKKDGEEKKNEGRR